MTRHIAAGLLGFIWDQRFEMDVTALLRPSKDNVITVRVEDSVGVGGLWKSILLIAPKAQSNAVKDGS